MQAFLRNLWCIKFEQSLSPRAQVTCDCSANTGCHDFLLNCSLRFWNEHAGRRWIHKPQDLPILRVDDLCRKLLWLVRALEYGLECGRLLRSMRPEDDPGRVFQDPRRERD